MTLPRVRFTVRRLMVAVGIVAVLFAAEATRRRWESLASTYRTKASRCERLARVSVHTSGLEADHGNEPEERKLQRIADHYVALANKYERAARYPWLPVAPD